MTLIGALADDLKTAMSGPSDGAERLVVLMLDPDRQFSRLAPELGTELGSHGLALIILDGLDEQFRTKMELIRREALGERTVVYGPGTGPEALMAKPGGPPDLWALVDYRYKGVVWDGTGQGGSGQLPAAVTLDRWLERGGVTFAAGSARAKLTAGGRDSRLARFAAKRAHRRLEDWPRSLSESAVRDELAGDPRACVIQLLLDPSAAVSAWGDDQDEVLERIGTTYGLHLGATDPGAVADEVATTLAVTDAWDVFGRTDDFPFSTRLPRGAQQRERVIELLRSDLLHRTDVLAPLRVRMARLEPSLATIETWATDKMGVPALLPHLLEVRVRRLLDQLDAAWVDGPSACLDVLERNLATTAVPEDAHPNLAVLHRVHQLSRLAREAREAAASVPTASKLCERYASSWWSLDALYLAVTVACREDHQLLTASEIASRVYFDYVDAVNQRFSDLIEKEPSWPPAGTVGMIDAVSKVWASSKASQAVLIIDALRFDLAQQLATALGPGATLEPVVTTLPSTTPYGMTALMPMASGEPAIAYVGDKVSISAGSRAGLEDRAGRKAYLESFLLARDKAETVAFAELESILQGAPIPKTRWVVVFSYALDDRGHSPADSASLPGEAARTIPRLVRAVERLHQAGIARVDVVTDHGFIYLPATLTDSLGHPDLPAKQTVVKNPRYSVLQQDAAATEVIRRASPMNAAISLGFPRGIRTLSKATVYLHGGISLQECVIARISSQAALATPRVEVEIDVTVTKVTGATIPVRVRPVGGPGSGQMTIDAPRPLKVRLSVETIIGDTAVDVVDPIILEIRADTPELASALYLRPDIVLKAGTTLSVRAQDDETGEALSTKQVPLVVDWEG